LPSVFFSAPYTPELYTLSLHDALPIWPGDRSGSGRRNAVRPRVPEPLFRHGSGADGSRPGEREDPHLREEDLLDEGPPADPRAGDRKSTRLNSSHDQISYAVFCLKKKK